MSYLKDEIMKSKSTKPSKKFVKSRHLKQRQGKIVSLEKVIKIFEQVANSTSKIYEYKITNIYLSINRIF